MLSSRAVLLLVLLLPLPASPAESAAPDTSVPTSASTPETWSPWSPETWSPETPWPASFAPPPVDTATPSPSLSPDTSAPPRSSSSGSSTPYPAPQTPSPTPPAQSPSPTTNSTWTSAPTAAPGGNATTNASSSGGSTQGPSPSSPPTPSSPSYPGVQSIGHTTAGDKLYLLRGGRCVVSFTLTAAWPNGAELWMVAQDSCGSHTMLTDPDKAELSAERTSGTIVVTNPEDGKLCMASVPASEAQQGSPSSTAFDTRVVTVDTFDLTVGGSPLPSQLLLSHGSAVTLDPFPLPSAEFSLGTKPLTYSAASRVLHFPSSSPASSNLILTTTGVRYRTGCAVHLATVTAVEGAVPGGALAVFEGKLSLNVKGDGVADLADRLTAGLADLPSAGCLAATCAVLHTKLGQGVASPEGASFSLPKQQLFDACLCLQLGASGLSTGVRVQAIPLLALQGVASGTIPIARNLTGQRLTATLPSSSMPSGLLWIALGGPPTSSVPYACGTPYNTRAAIPLVTANGSDGSPAATFCLPPAVKRASVWIAYCPGCSLESMPQASGFAKAPFTVEDQVIEVAGKSLGSDYLVTAMLGESPSYSVTIDGLPATGIYFSIQDVCGTRNISSTSTACSRPAECGNISSEAVRVLGGKWTLPSPRFTHGVTTFPLSICIALVPSSSCAAVNSSQFVPTGLNYSVDRPDHLQVVSTGSLQAEWSNGSLVQGPTVALVTLSGTQITSGEKVLYAGWIPGVELSNTTAGELGAEIPVTLLGRHGVQYQLAVETAGLQGVLIGNYTMGPCPDNQLAVELVSRQKGCRGCPSGGVCNGTSMVIPKSGYWSSSVYSTTLYSCNHGCGEGGHCTEGYASDRFNPRCSICAEGYGRAGEDLCAQCGNKGKNVVLIIVGFVAFFIVLFILVLVTLQPTKHDPFTVLVKILLNHLSISSRVGNFSDNLYSVLEPLFTIQSNVAEVPTEYAAVDCALSLSVSTRFAIVQALPVIITVFLGVIFALLRLRRIVRASMQTKTKPASFRAGWFRRKKSHHGVVMDEKQRRTSAPNLSYESPPGTADQQQDDTLVNEEVSLSKLHTEMIGTDFAKEHSMARSKSVLSCDAGYEGNILHEKLNIDSRKLWVVWVQTMVILLFLIYPTVLQECSRVLVCEDIRVFYPPDSPEYYAYVEASENSNADVEHMRYRTARYLVADRRVECAGGEYTRLMAIAILMSLVYGLGIPGGVVALVLVLRKRLGRRVAHKTFSFFISGYRTGNRYGTVPQRWWWESLTMVRKAAFVVIVAFGKSGTSDTTKFWTLYAAIAVVTVALAAQLSGKPFRTEGLNSLEALSLSTILLTLCAGLLYILRLDDDPYYVLDPDAPGDRSQSFVVVTVALGVVNAVVVLLLLYFIAVEGRKKLRHVVVDNSKSINAHLHRMPACLVSAALSLHLIETRKGYRGSCALLCIERREGVGDLPASTTVMLDVAGEDDLQDPGQERYRVLIVPREGLRRWDIREASGGTVCVAPSTAYSRTQGKPLLGSFWAEDAPHDHPGAVSFWYDTKDAVGEGPVFVGVDGKPTTAGLSLLAAFRPLTAAEAKECKDEGRYRVALADAHVGDQEGEEDDVSEQPESDWSDGLDAPTCDVSQAEEYFQQVGARAGMRYYLCHGVEGHSLRKVAEKLQEYANALEASLEEALTDKRALEDLLDDRSQMVSNLENELDNALAEHGRLQSEHAALTGERTELLEALKRLSDEQRGKVVQLVQLRAALAGKSKTSDDVVSRLTERLDELAESEKGKEEEIAVLNKRLAALEVKDKATGVLQNINRTKVEAIKRKLSNLEGEARVQRETTAELQFRLEREAVRARQRAVKMKLDERKQQQEQHERRLRERRAKRHVPKPSQGWFSFRRRPEVSAKPQTSDPMDPRPVPLPGLLSATSMRKQAFDETVSSGHSMINMTMRSVGSQQSDQGSSVDK